MRCQARGIQEMRGRQGGSALKFNTRLIRKLGLRNFLRHGLHGVEFIVSDAHPGMAAARQAVFPPCLGNAVSSTSSKTPRPRCHAWRCVRMSPMTSAPSSPRWIWPPPRYDLCFPQHTTTACAPATSLSERVNQELKRRTRVAALFPNEASLLRLATALLCE